MALYIGEVDYNNTSTTGSLSMDLQADGESSFGGAFVKKSFGVSVKNIPISIRREHNMQMIYRSERLIKRMRWEAFFYLNPQEGGRRKDTFGLPSQRPAPQSPELREFERGMYNLVANITYKEVPRSTFQRGLKEEIDEIKGEKRVYVAADKSSNYYKMQHESYERLLDKAVHKDFKKARDGEEEMITKEAGKVATGLEIADRVFKTEMKPAKISLKDHKEDFMNNPRTRLINPTKSNLGKVSKWKMDKLNSQVRSKTRLQQWLNTDATLAWFRALPDKQDLSFVVCDIVDYYPSITADLLNQALDWASRFVDISADDRALYHHTKNSLLFHQDSTWVKRGGANFDIAQGSFDGAESTDLVGLFLLHKLEEVRELNTGLYRDDMLAVTKIHGKEAEKLKQRICGIFKSVGLTVKVEVNKKVVNYLNVTLSLVDGSHRDYMKPGNVINYVHVLSNHPPSVIKSISKGVNHRLNANSSSKEMFDAAKGPYQEALARSGHSCTLTYSEEELGGLAPRRRRRRKKNHIIWFNPPWCSSVSTNVGRKFLNLLERCFPATHPLSKIFNRRTVKISYSTMPSLGRIIEGHNSKVMRGEVAEVPKRPWGNCSCPRRTREAGECPLGGECLAENIVYRASVEVKADEEVPAVVELTPVKTYLGLSSTEWKERLGNHKQTFKKASRKGETCLSSYIWELKAKGMEEGRNFNISWALVGRANTYSPSSDLCRLCLLEKSMIMRKPEWALLNSRDEFFNPCRHKTKLLLSSIT